MTIVQLLRDLHECQEIAERRRVVTVAMPSFGSLPGPWNEEMSADEVERGTVFWDAMPLREDG